MSEGWRIGSRCAGMVALSFACLAGAALPAAKVAPAPVAAAAPASAPDDGAPFVGRWVHGFAAYGAPKYAAGFAHFAYVNPDAPKGGTLKLKNPDRRSSFDKFNPWTTRGNAPAGITIWTVETLAWLAQDEPQSIYGLLAKEFWVAPDFSLVRFRIDPRARFHNGDPVLAKDVVHSYTMLTSKEAGPDVQAQLTGVERVVAEDERTVRFDLREKVRDTVFIAALMPVFSHRWGEGKKFDQIVTEIPITSGPYVVSRAEMPRRIEFSLDPKYWGADLAVRRGHNNFARIVYRMYQENAVAREAFKAREFDYMRELSAGAWVLLHRGPKWDDGRIVKHPMTTATGRGLQAYNLNLRLAKFQDRRVREALGLTYDFEATSKTGIYKRAYSVFSNSPFAAQGTPGPGELALLEPLRDKVPPEVFGPAYKPPTTAGDPNGLRRNLLRARELLAAAGWKLAPDGKLRNAKGEAFVIEYMEVRESPINDWQQNMAKLGIELKQRIVDFALFRRRLEKYDYDMVTIVEPEFTLPRVPDLTRLYGSEAADQEGNDAYRGVKDPAVDQLLAAMSRAQTMQQLQDAARAFDRVVMWNHYQIPDLYGNSENVSHWNKFGVPKVQADHFSAEHLISGFIEFGPWPLWTWWDKSLEKKTKP